MLLPVWTLLVSCVCVHVVSAAVPKCFDGYGLNWRADETDVEKTCECNDQDNQSSDPCRNELKIYHLTNTQIQLNILCYSDNCKDAVFYGHNVQCIGDRSCVGATFRMIANVQCSGANSCENATFMNDANAVCDGQNACKNARFDHNLSFSCKLESCAHAKVYRSATGVCRAKSCQNIAIFDKSSLQCRLESCKDIQSQFGTSVRCFGDDSCKPTDSTEDLVCSAGKYRSGSDSDGNLFSLRCEACPDGMWGNKRGAMDITESCKCEEANATMVLVEGVHTCMCQSNYYGYATKDQCVQCPAGTNGNGVGTGDGNVQSRCKCEDDPSQVIVHNGTEYVCQDAPPVSSDGVILIAAASAGAVLAIGLIIVAAVLYCRFKRKPRSSNRSGFDSPKAYSRSRSFTGNRSVGSSENTRDSESTGKNEAMSTGERTLIYTSVHSLYDEIQDDALQHLKNLGEKKNAGETKSSGYVNKSVRNLYDEVDPTYFYAPDDDSKSGTSNNSPQAPSRPSLSNISGNIRKTQQASRAGQATRELIRKPAPTPMVPGTSIDTNKFEYAEVDHTWSAPSTPDASSQCSSSVDYARLQDGEKW